ncbi:MAG: adenine phosphoribosyltransferase [Oligoflexales bacterium]|nr:adenine phosphoribosyltransferase [Oligoflexales bacterium]
MHLEEYIRNIPDFPKPGIQFKDVTPLLRSPDTLTAAVKEIAKNSEKFDFDLIAGIESRGFIFGASLSMLLNKGFIPIRKPGKLPADTFRETYDLEYGSNSLEIHKDAVSKGGKVLVVDDLLATGGTTAASIKLIERCGGSVVGCSFLIELEFLKGRDFLKPYKVTSIIKY